MIRLNNSSALLKQYNPSLVDQLLKTYLSEKDAALILGKTKLGAPENADDTRPPYKLEMKLALETLIVIKNRVSPNFDALKKRYARSKNLRLGAAIISTLTGIGLVNFSFTQANQELLIISSSLNLASSGFLLVANHLDAPSIDGSRNLGKVFESLNDLFAEAEKTEFQILRVMETQAFGPHVEPLIEKAESLAINLSKLERELLS